MENRETADSLNAKELIGHIDALGSSVVKFSSINIPPSASCESPKSFQNVRDALYLGIDCPVIITENTQIAAGVHNGAIFKFKGAVWLRENTVVLENDFESLEALGLDENFVTQRQVSKHLNGVIEVYEKGITLESLNDVPVTIESLNTLNKDSKFKAVFRIPSRCPYITGCRLILESDNYLGPNAFPSDPSMAKYYLICPEWKQFTTEDSSKKKNKWRYQFPIELAFVMTSFKGIGATHAYTQIMVSPKFENFYVCNTRTLNPTHIYIPPGHFPSLQDLQLMRLKPSVIFGENFERTLKYKHAQTMRKERFDHVIEKYGNAGETYPNKDEFNALADIIQDDWNTHHDIVKKYISTNIEKYADAIFDPEKYSVSREIFIQVSELMNKTSEKFRYEDVPRLSTEFRNSLRQYKQSKARMQRNTNKSQCIEKEKEMKSNSKSSGSKKIAPKPNNARLTVGSKTQSSKRKSTSKDSPVRKARKIKKSK